MSSQLPQESIHNAILVGVINGTIEIVAEQGNTDAQCKLGWCYESAEGG